MNPFFDNVPGFDQPLAVLKHCHDRIRKQLATLDKLLAHLPVHGADQQAQQAARAVLRYFSKAAPLHHEDEEIDLLPTLQQTAQGADAALLQQLLPTILHQHEQMASQWHVIEAQLNQIAEASSAALLASAIQDFAALYATHMEIEETQIAPMAQRLFSEQQMQTLGQAMQTRRAI